MEGKGRDISELNNQNQREGNIDTGHKSYINVISSF